MPNPNHSSSKPPASPGERASLAPAHADVTLLELVRLLGATIEDDREVAAAARRLLRRGDVRLVGNFRGEPIESF
ncbi:MAG: hypothetical protein QF570_11780 [Myxococcota bacterium]|jgi:hypothetical protein|nr:hypothetical protein [Myxococcota bacterium]